MELIRPFQESFEKYLADKPLPDYPPNLYGPANYIISLGGKRLRPVFVLMGCDLYSTHYTEALPLAWAVEVFHNFTLVHDDVMDAADIRRGKATVHKLFGLNTAILSGDVMMVKSLEMILKYDEPVLVKKLLDVFTKMAIEVCEGQQLDMDFETSDQITIDDYIQMITLKTSVLLAASIQMGAILGGAAGNDPMHIYEFARNFGIAFQLQDDVLDTFGDSAVVGKRIGGDIIQNKKTYLYLKALELASHAQKAVLQDLYHTDSEIENTKIQKITDIFKELNVAEYAAQTIQAYRDLAISHLEACNISPNHKKSLTEMVDQLVSRSY